MASERSQRAVRMAAVLVTLALTALFSAKGATQLLAASLLPVSPESANKQPPLRMAGKEERALTPREIGEAVLTRNIFDSVTGAIAWLAPPPPPPPEPTNPDGTPIVASDPSLSDPLGEPAFCPPGSRLVAVMMEPRHPERSVATIEVAGKPLLYRPGADVQGAELVGLREHRVFLRPKGQQLCQLAMFVPPQPVVPPPITPAAPPPPPDEKPPPHKSSITEEELNAGVTAVSETQYNISRQLLDKVLGNQAELMRAARVIPFEENGRVVGVKVYGIRRNALLGKLGIQNGDVLRTINGFDLSSPDTALEAYTKLRETNEFSIAMMRRGAPKTMEYSVK
jgi:general secretion pathway protein C